MKDDGMQRMRRALAAIKQAEMAELGRNRALADAARAHATEMRAAARMAAAPETAAEMAALAEWQHALEWRARMAEAAAASADEAAVPLKEKLARTLGRENVTLEMIADAAREQVKLTERRAEDVVRRA